MPDYRRARATGATWFFTVNLLERHGNTLLVDEIERLRTCLQVERARRPFAILAWVGNPPVFNGHQKWSYAANANFCIGVIPPSAMFGRSWL